MPSPSYEFLLSGSGITIANGDVLGLDHHHLDFFDNGDLNHDRLVDFSDFTTLQANYGTTGKVYSDGDMDADGDVD